MSGQRALANPQATELLDAILTVESVALRALEWVWLGDVLADSAEEEVDGVLERTLNVYLLRCRVHFTYYNY